MSSDRADSRALPFEARGEGDPVLLIPGTGFGADNWGEFGDLLAQRRRVIAYDRRGFTSAASELAPDMRAHAEGARSVLERAGALPADVVGWSAGGLVALALAVEHPSSCRSLLLIEPSVHGLRAVTLSAVAMSLRAQAAKLRRGQRAATDVSYRWTFAYRGLGRSAWDEMPEPWREVVVAHPEAVRAEQPQETTLRYPPTSALRRLDLPVAIVIGGRSQPYFHRIARRLERVLPRASMHSIPNGCHAPHFDSPAEVAAIVTKASAPKTTTEGE
jgi:pimeloyl-ACP methyl ester carboxylesterase